MVQQLDAMYSAIITTHADNLRHLINSSINSNEHPDAPLLVRLEALRNVIHEQLKSEGCGFQCTDVDVSVEMLRAALTRGTPYQEDIAAAVLYASAAMGAFWFADARLLELDQLLDGKNRPLVAVSSFFDPNLDILFNLATENAAAIQAPASYHLLEMLQNECSDDALRQLSETIFFSKAPEALQHFIAYEQFVFKHYQIMDHSLQKLCFAGDFVFGIGRCVRWLSCQSPNLSTPEKILLLKEALLGMV